MIKTKMINTRVRKLVDQGVDPTLAGQMARQEVRRLSAKALIKERRDIKRSQENRQPAPKEEEKDDVKDNGLDAKKPATKGASKGLRLEGSKPKVRNKTKQAKDNKKG